MASAPPTMRLAAQKGSAVRPRHSGQARWAASTARPSAAGAIQVEERKARPSAAPNRAPVARGRVAARGSTASAPLSAARLASSGSASCACTLSPTEPMKTRSAAAAAVWRASWAVQSRAALYSSQHAASTNAPLASRAAEWKSTTSWNSLPKASATQMYSGASFSQVQEATCGTSRSPLRAMSCTMPMPIASSDFQGSCPARPGTTNASARPASHAGGGGRVRRGGMPRRLSGFLLGVAALELLDAARSVDELVLAGVEGVRFRGHLDLHERVFLAVLPLHRLAALGVDGRARQESMVRAGIEKDHRPVVGVDACLHGRAPAEKVANYKGKPKNRALTPIVS